MYHHFLCKIFIRRMLKNKNKCKSKLNFLLGVYMNTLLYYLLPLKNNTHRP